MKALAISKSNGQESAKHRQLWPAHRPSRPDFSRIMFKVQGGVEFVNPERVSYLEAQSNYSIVHFEDGRKLVLSKTLKQCSARFPAFYLRIHQSYLVNPTFMRTYDRQHLKLILDDGHQMPVSRSGKAVMQEFMSEMAK